MGLFSDQKIAVSEGASAPKQSKSSKPIELPKLFGGGHKKGRKPKESDEPQPPSRPTTQITKKIKLVQMLKEEGGISLPDSTLRSMVSDHLSLHPEMPDKASVRAMKISYMKTL